MTVITKQDLVSQISKASDVQKDIVQNVFEATLETFKKALYEGHDIRLLGFGSFSVQDSKERQGKHPRTGDTITIPASKRVSFRMGKELKEGVNGVVSDSQENVKSSTTKPSKK